MVPITFLLILLKALGLVTISWWWIWFTLWFPVALGFGVCAIVLLFGFLAAR
jgi:hypothetical protein